MNDWIDKVLAFRNLSIEFLKFRIYFCFIYSEFARHFLDKERERERDYENESLPCEVSYREVTDLSLL